MYMHVYKYMICIFYFSLTQTDTVKRFQILDKTVISHSANIFDKSMNPTILGGVLVV